MNDPTITIPRMLTPPEAARAAGVCHKTILRWIWSGKLYARSPVGGEGKRKHGHRWRIHAAALWAFLERR